MKYPLNAIRIAICLGLTLLLSGFQTENLKQLRPHYASIPKGQIEYYCFGQGSPIILIPGYVTDITSWHREFLSALAQQHQVIVINNRNVGGSHVASRQYESRDLARDTYQLMQELNLKKPTIIGISMGGMIAQQVATQYQDKLGPLILINTAIAGKQAVHPSPDVEKILLNLPSNKLSLYIEAINLFFPPSWRAPMAYSLVADRFLPQQYTEVDIEKILPYQRQLVLHWINDDATAQKIKQLHLPVLILNGKADSVIPPANSVILAKTIPHAYLIRWQEGGHALTYQYPKQLAQLINEFLDEHALN